MSEKLDVIIFGATGFTGQYAIKDAAELLTDFKWGVAGRNRGRLQHTLQTVGKSIDKDLSQIPVIVADVSNKTSIEEMAKQCKVIINCCGPYQHYGEVVVKAAIEAGTHHVDVSGEPQFIDKMQLKYNDLAQEKGSYVISACGFDSVPADLGVVYAEKNFPGTVNSVEMFWENKIDYKNSSNKALLHYGTWESAIYALKNGKEILALQKQINKGKFPELKPKLKLYPFIQKLDFLQSYFIPFPSTDRETIQRSQRVLYETEQKRPVQIQTYVGFNSYFIAILVQIWAVIILILSQFAFTRKLLLKYPTFFTCGIVSHQGPLDVNANAQFFSHTFRVKGWSKGQEVRGTPNQEIKVRVSGYNPFYGFTTVSLVCAAKILLKETKKMPKNGGVIAPGAAFANTSFIEELSKPKNGLKFEVLH